MATTAAMLAPPPSADNQRASREAILPTIKICAEINTRLKCSESACPASAPSDRVRRSEDVALADERLQDVPA